MLQVRFTHYTHTISYHRQWCWDAATICAGEWHDGNLLQVTENAVYILSVGSDVQRVYATDHHVVNCCWNVESRYVVLHTNNNRMIVLHVDDGATSQVYANDVANDISCIACCRFRNELVIYLGDFQSNIDIQYITTNDKTLRLSSSSRYHMNDIPNVIHVICENKIIIGTKGGKLIVLEHSGATCNVLEHSLGTYPVEMKPVVSKIDDYIVVCDGLHLFKVHMVSTIVIFRLRCLLIMMIWRTVSCRCSMMLCHSTA